MDEDKRLVQASWWEGLAVGKTGSCPDGHGHALLIFNPIFCWWVGLCSLSVVWPEVAQSWSLESLSRANGDLLPEDLCLQRTAVAGAPDPQAGHYRHMPRLQNTHRQVWFSLLWGHCSFPLGPGVHKVCLCPPRVSVSLVLWKFCNQIPMTFKVRFPGDSQSLCQNEFKMNIF